MMPDSFFPDSEFPEPMQRDGEVVLLRWVSLMAALACIAAVLL
jgi:hypothetical protein